MQRKALIIEDNAEEARHIMESLKKIGFFCEWTDDGCDGYAQLLSKDYAVAIVDNLLPGLHGREIIARLRHRGNQVPIIVLSQLGSEQDFVAGLNGGADDYMHKPCSFDELQARVEALLRRAGNVMSRRVLVHKDLRIECDNRRVTRKGRDLSLTPMEYNLLEYLMRNAGRIISQAMITEQVWGFDSGTSPNLVAMRLCELRRKLIGPGEDDPIVTRRGFGYGIL